MSASLLRRLIAAGTPDDLIDEVAELLSDVRALEKARAKNAERQARFKANHAPDNVTNVSDVISVTDPSPFDKETLSPTPPIKEINIPTREGGDAPTRKAGSFPCPQGCDQGDWRDLLANRKAKRLPMTPGAYRKLLADLAQQSDEEWPPGRVLRHAAESGWAAIYDPRSSQGNRQNGKRPANDRPDGPLNPVVAAGIENEARFASGRRASF